ncbi:MAG: hypothetical protein JF614_01335 [Acidobacteria bacterium]|nr:hypothetical protein [Acidobacteriota bacterium]
MAPSPQGPLRVASIVGHRQVEMAVLCLGSLLRHSAEELALRLHDDGSLTAADRERLAAELRGPEVVSRAEADEQTADFLARHPALRAFRRGNVMALKLIDAMLFAGDELAYCDSDVLFLRPFSGLYPLRETAAGAMFMSDRQNAYSIRSWHLLRYPGLRLPWRLNAGITAFRAAGFDLDLLEWYVSRPELQFAPVWMEQTAWGLLAGRVGCRLLDPDQVAIPVPGEPAPAGIVALHFVSPVRSLLAGYAVPSASEARQPVALRSAPARRCRAVDLAVTEARRWLARRVSG